jgi:acyl-CoA thioesterase FadM
MSSPSYYSMDRKTGLNTDHHSVHGDLTPQTQTGPGSDTDTPIVDSIGGAVRGLFGVSAAWWSGVLGRTSRNDVRRGGRGIASCIVLGIMAAVAGYSLSFLIPDIPYQLKMLYITHFTKQIALAEDEKPDDAAVSLPTVTHSSIVLPTDIDGNFHMNNARYLRELNFARRHCFYALGIWPFCNSHNINLIVRAQAIRYRRELRVWDKYTIVHKIAGWSRKEKCFYIEAHFEDKEKFVCAVQFCKYCIVMGGGKEENKGGTGPPTTPKQWSPSSILAACGLLPVSKASSVEENTPAAFAAWEECNKLSSKELRPDAASSK